MSPVDSFAPKTKAINVTIIMAIPFIPDLDMPITKAAVKAMTHAVIEMFDVMANVTNEV